MMFDRLVYEVFAPYRFANNAMYVLAMLVGAYYSYVFSYGDILSPQSGEEPMFFMLLFTSVEVLYTYLSYYSDEDLLIC